MSISRTALCAMVFACIAVSGALAQSGSEFRCAEPANEAQRIICADPELVALNDQVAARYAELRVRLADDIALALRNDQRAYWAHRDAIPAAVRSARERHRALAILLDARERFLNAVSEQDQPGLVGRWGNVYGDVSIDDDGYHHSRGEFAKGTYAVDASTMDPGIGRWLCLVRITPTVPRDGLIDFTPSNVPPGWKLLMKRVGPLLSVEQVSPDGKPHPWPFCGDDGGSVAGLYLRKKP